MIIYIITISYDVSALFTSIPVTSAMEIIRNKLEQDTELHKRTTMSANNILELLEFWLCNTYFLFQGQLYEQSKGAAMGSPVPTRVANLYMGSFEHRVQISAVKPPKLWERYVDDTFVILQQSQKNVLATHELCRSFHKLHHSRNQTWWFYAIPGHTCNTTKRWNLNNQCVVFESTVCYHA